ncbi:MAG: protein kinase [Planctomycetes bacterium]|nr:protein kinase [Planctomycetota bacterium]
MPTPADRLLIELAVKNHLITQPEGDACLAELPPGVDAGAHLVARSLLKDRHVASLQKKVQKLLEEGAQPTRPAPVSDPGAPTVGPTVAGSGEGADDATFVAPDPASSPLASAEGAVVLFGQIALRLGMLAAGAQRHGMTPEALLELGLKKQEELAQKGSALRIGAILTKAGVLTNEQVHEVLRYQEKWIVTCSACHKRYNVSGTAGRSSAGLSCIACGGQLVASGASGITVFQTHPGQGGPALAPMPAPAAPTRSTARHEATPDDPAGLVGVEWKGHRVEKVLGRGGMGAVYKATQLELRRPVALKVMLRAGAQAAQGERERFEREARLVGKLNHPNIVQIYNAEWNDDLCWFTMEFVKGQDFKVVLRSGQSPIRKGAEVVAKVARAMDFAHRRQVIHRDLKPQNIMVVEETGEPKVLDFGLAKSVSKEEQEKLTQMGSFLGTPSYMAPEQAGGDPDAIDARADVYALGAILYEVLTGRPPFTGKKAIQVIKAVLKEDPVPCRQIFPQAPAELEAVALKALRKDPAERFQTAGALADAIEDVIGKVSRTLGTPESGEHPTASSSGGTGSEGGEKKKGFFSRIFGGG